MVVGVKDETEINAFLSIHSVMFGNKCYSSVQDRIESNLKLLILKVRAVRLK